MKILNTGITFQSNLLNNVDDSWGPNIHIYRVSRKPNFYLKDKFRSFHYAPGDFFLHF